MDQAMADKSIVSQKVDTTEAVKKWGGLHFKPTQPTIKPSTNEHKNNNNLFAHRPVHRHHHRIAHKRMKQMQMSATKQPIPNVNLTSNSQNVVSNNATIVSTKSINANSPSPSKSATNTVETKKERETPKERERLDEVENNDFVKENEKEKEKDKYEHIDKNLTMFAAEKAQMSSNYRRTNIPNHEVSLHLND